MAARPLRTRNDDATRRAPNNVQRLREAQLLGKNSSSLKFFAQWGDRFELGPPDKPTQVRLGR